MHTGIKGDIGVSKAISYYLENKYNVFLPFSNHLPYDLIIEKNNKFEKIQIKYRSLEEKGSVSIKLENNGVKVNLNSFDKYFIYCIDTNSSKEITTDEILSREITTAFKVRFTPANNGTGRNYLGEEKPNFSCPYCGATKKASGGYFTDWISVRNHTSHCTKNTGEYYVDKISGPIHYKDEKLKEKITSSYKDVKRSFQSRNKFID